MRKNLCVCDYLGTKDVRMLEDEYASGVPLQEIALKYHIPDPEKIELHAKHRFYLEQKRKDSLSKQNNINHATKL